jgi:hypothetical protein
MQKILLEIKNESSLWNFWRTFLVMDGGGSMLLCKALHLLEKSVTNVI